MQRCVPGVRNNVGNMTMTIAGFVPNLAPNVPRNAKGWQLSRKAVIEFKLLGSLDGTL